jgi:hypothetical protein
MNNVIWKEVPEFDGNYIVSNTGIVKSLKFGKERILSNSIGSRGALQVGLHKYYPRKYKVHKLMQVAFGLPEGKIEHLDGDKTNNTLENFKVL